MRHPPLVHGLLPAPLVFPPLLLNVQTVLIRQVFLIDPLVMELELFVGDQFVACLLVGLLAEVLDALRLPRRLLSGNFLRRCTDPLDLVGEGDGCRLRLALLCGRRVLALVPNRLLLLLLVVGPIRA